MFTIMRMKSQYLAAAMLLSGGLHPLTLAVTAEPTEKTIRGKSTTTTRPTVRRTSKDPTNIPTSSRRFRPSFTEENAVSEIGCLYWNGKIILKFNPYQGEARIIVRTQEGERLYRTSTRSDISINVGDVIGDYHVEVYTTAGSECTFDFTVAQ